MPNDYRSRTAGIEAILPERFRNRLTDAEMRLLHAAPDGHLAICGANDNDKDKSNDPSNIRYWDETREIRADLIRWLCVDPEASKMLDPSGIKVYGANISAQLNLSYADVPFPLRLTRCRVIEGIDLRFVRLPLLSLSGSVIGALNAEGAHVAESVWLDNGFASHGGIRLYNARIGGDLHCNNASLNNPAGVALEAGQVEIKGQVLLANGFSADGQVSLYSSHITGDLICSQCRLKYPGHYALIADRSDIRGQVSLSNSFSADGGVSLYGAHIEGDLNCCQCHITNPGGKALLADNARIGGSALFRDDFSAIGAISLMGSQIGGDLNCHKGSFTNADGFALNADHVQIVGHVYMTEDFTAKGEVNLAGARIGRGLDCHGGSFVNSGNNAFVAEEAVIGGSVLMSENFSAAGEVCLQEAQIGNTLHCERAYFENLSLSNAVVKQTFFWNNVSHISELDLRNASVGNLSSDKGSWPTPGKLHLDGFVYGGISNDLKDASWRLTWLKRQPEFSAQSYRQLAKVLSDLGDEDGSKQVLMDMEIRSRAEERSKIIHTSKIINTSDQWRRSASDNVLRFTIGYGIYPERTIVELGVLSAIGWIIHRRAQLAGAMTPTDKDAYKDFSEGRGLPANYPPFNSLIYSIENCIPLLKLGQDDHWQPDPNPKRHEAPRVSGTGKLTRLKLWFITHLADPSKSPTALRWIRWTMIVAGWILATSFVSGLTGIVKAH
jgi:hypothetical protein